MKSILLLLTAVFFWALNFYLGKITMEYVSPNASAFWRFLFAVLTLFVLSYSNLPTWNKIKENAWGIFLVGFVGLFAFIFFFFQGLKYTSEMNGALFISLNPATTLLLAVVLQGHKVTGREMLGILLAFFGAIYLLTKGDISTLFDLSFNKGDALFIAATITFAFNNIWLKKYANQLGNMNFTFLTNVCCWLGFAFLMLLETEIPMLSLPPRFWLAAIGMGVPGTALAYYCWNYGLSEIGPARGAIFINALPLFAALFAVIFGAELLGYHLVSAILIIIGLLLVQWRFK